jgi:Leucine-rich repeat (LRR) protein
MPSRVMMGLCRLLTALLCATAVQAMHVTLSSESNAPAASPSEWSRVINAISAVVEDDDLRSDLRDLLRDSASVNYCLLNMTTCDVAGHLIAIHINHVYGGGIELSKLPSTVKSVTISDCDLNQPPDFSSVPAWLQSLHLTQVTFREGPLVLSAKLALTSLSCSYCNLQQVEWPSLPSLTELDLSHNNLRQIDFSVVPQSLRRLNVSHNHIATEVSSLSHLPRSVTQLDLSHNRMHGGIRSTLFSSSLEVLSLRNNVIAGFIDVGYLPFSLITLDIGMNKISGNIGPMSNFLSLTSLRADHNFLTAVEWHQLPPHLVDLNVSFNQITGPLPTHSIPSTLVSLDIHRNQFSGKLDLAKLPESLELLDVSSNAFSGPVELDKFSQSIRFVYLQENKLEGNPDLTNLPVDLRRILIYDNNWDSLMPSF